MAVSAAAAAFWTMRDGIGLTNDSRSYVALSDGLTARAAGVAIGANDLLNRRFPPAFPATLAAVDALLRVGVYRAARLMNVACLTVSTGLVAWLAWRATRERSRAVLAAALFALSAGTANTHIHLWSEPTFAVWMLLTACALDAYLSGVGARRWLIAASLCCAAAMMTRYAAAALVLAATVVVLARSPRTRRLDRAIDAVAFGLFPAVALLLWQLAVPQSAAGVGQRTIEFIPVGWPKFDQCLQAFGTWVAWHALAPALARTTGVAAIGATLFLIARPCRALANPALALPWTYLAVYPPFLCVSLLFLDASTPLDVRILAPLHAMAIVVGCATIGRGAEKFDRASTPGQSAVAPPRFPTLDPGRRDYALPRRGGLRKSFGWVVVAVLVLAQLASTTCYLATVRYTGLGYNSLRWRESQTVAFVRTLPWQLPVFTTHHVALDFLAERNVFAWPTLPRTGTSADDDESDAPAADESRAASGALDRAVLPMLDAVRAAGGRGYFVELRWPRQSKRFLTREELNRYVKLRPIARNPDGRVFKIEGIVDDVRTATTTRAAR